MSASEILEFRLIDAIILVAVISLVFRKRDFYVVIREFRIVSPNEFGKGKKIESSYNHHFDDFQAAKAFFELHESYTFPPQYEDRQQINYVYAVPARSAQSANRKMTKKRHHEAMLLVETPYSSIRELKRHWDEERKSRQESM